MAPLELVEAASLLAATATDARRLLWLVLLATGVRKGEVLALRWRATSTPGP